MGKTDAKGAVETIPPFYAGAYAESSDGLDWYRPILNRYEHRGSNKNSLVGGYEYVYSHVALPEGHPWKYMRPNYPPGHKKHLFIQVSQDGFDWERTTEKPVVERVCDSHTLLAGGWDPSIGRYVGYFRPDWTGETYPGRTVGRSTSPDGIHWSELQTILVPDDADPVGTEFYSFYVFPYEGQYIGIMNVLHLDRQCRDLAQQVPTGQEQTMDVQLFTSRDGILWDRQNNRGLVLPLGPDGSWDDRYLYATSLVTLTDRIRLYYGGSNARHHLGDLEKLGATDESGRKYEFAAGIAEYRLDGFACLTPQFRNEMGVAETAPFRLDGERILLNADASNGEVRAEVCDREGRTLSGFSLDDSAPIVCDSTGATLRWKDRCSLAEHRDRDVRLRIELRGRSRLFAIRVR
ncbi:MAG: hypothetical protein HYV35_10315 [Lentisphaerae bacterium]|nr:hypothetical protein [Lentisphaerota bacterium]